MGHCGSGAISSAKELITVSGNEMCKSGCSNGLDYGLREERSQAILGVGLK